MPSTEKVIYRNVGATIARLKKDGVTGMSMANLFQVTPTTGVTCPVSMYRPLFEEVATAAASKSNFPITPVK